MRKITSKQDEQKKKKRNQLIVGVVLIVVMLFSTLGYAFSGQGGKSSTKKITYNNFEFANNNGYWILNLGKAQFSFLYNPEEVEKVNSNIEDLNHYSNQPLYLTPNYQEAYTEVARNLNPFVQRIQFACEENKTCNGDYPTKTCDSNFIIFEEANETNITQENNCVYIKAPLENLTQTTDEFLFKIIGVEND